MVEIDDNPQGGMGATEQAIVPAPNPTEYLHHVFAHVDHGTFFSTVPRVCRRWHAAFLNTRRTHLDLTFLSRKARLRLTLTSQSGGKSALEDLVSCGRFQNATHMKIPPWLNGNDARVRIIVLHCPNLISVDLSYCNNITDTSLSVIAEAYPNLRTVHMPGCPNITENGIMRLVRACPRLEVIDFTACALNLQILPSLAKHCPALTCVRLNENFGVVNDALISLATNCPQLTEVCVAIVDNRSSAYSTNHSYYYEPCGGSLTDKGVMELAKRCPNLEKMDFSFMTHLTDRIIDTIVENCPTLKELVCVGCPKLTLKGAAKLAKGCPALKHFYHYHQDSELPLERPGSSQFYRLDNRDSALALKDRSRRFGRSQAMESDTIRSDMYSTRNRVEHSGRAKIERYGATGTFKSYNRTGLYGTTQRGAFNQKNDPHHVGTTDPNSLSAVWDSPRGEFKDQDPFRADRDGELYGSTTNDLNSHDPFWKSDPYDHAGLPRANINVKQLAAMQLSRESQLKPTGLETGAGPPHHHSIANRPYSNWVSNQPQMSAIRTGSLIGKYDATSTSCHSESPWESGSDDCAEPAFGCAMAAENSTEVIVNHDWKIPQAGAVSLTEPTAVQTGRSTLSAAYRNTKQQEMAAKLHKIGLERNGPKFAFSDYSETKPLIEAESREEERCSSTSPSPTDKSWTFATFETSVPCPTPPDDPLWLSGFVGASAELGIHHDHAATGRSTPDSETGW
eukprot:m.437339 g.437339  ORF g.437339 m.437339 type:complete len:736 (-) comp18101_c0_seq1:1764-3971(-)